MPHFGFFVGIKKNKRNEVQPRSPPIPKALRAFPRCPHARFSPPGIRFWAIRTVCASYRLYI